MPLRCDAWRRHGGAFTFGPVRWHRCTNNATVLLTVEQEGEVTLDSPTCDTCWRESMSAEKITIKEVKPIPIQALACLQELLITPPTGITTKHLTEHDWLQINMAAKGCVSGNLAEWPHLKAAFDRAGIHTYLGMPDSTMRDFAKMLYLIREP